MEHAQEFPNINHCDVPFRHITIAEVFPAEEFGHLMSVYRSGSWERYDRGSYLYDVFCVHRQEPGEQPVWHPVMEGHKAVFEKFTSSRFKTLVRRYCGVNINGIRDITFHRMMEGDYSRKHTDVNPYGEIFRLIVYLNDFNQFSGGQLFLFADGDTDDPEIRLKPQANSACGFNLLEDLYHEVETVSAGERACLIISFF